MVVSRLCGGGCRRPRRCSRLTSRFGQWLVELPVSHVLRCAGTSYDARCCDVAGGSITFSQGRCLKIGRLCQHTSLASAASFQACFLLLCLPGCSSLVLQHSYCDILASQQLCSLRVLIQGAFLDLQVPAPPFLFGRACCCIRDACFDVQVAAAPLGSPSPKARVHWCVGVLLDASMSFHHRGYLLIVPCR